MPHAGFLTVLAEGPIRPRTESAQFRQTIRARLSGDARLGQNSASAALAEGGDGKNVREISRSISWLDRYRDRERVGSVLQIRVWLEVKSSADRQRSPLPTRDTLS